MNTQTIIHRKPTVLHSTGFSNSTLYTRIGEGLFVPPISLGGRAVGFPSNEVDAVIGAMISGKSKDEIKALVTSLVEQRQDGGLL